MKVLSPMRFVLTLIAFFPVALYASGDDHHHDDHDHDHETPEQHLIVETPKTVEEALSLLTSETDAVKRAWQTHDLDAIHISSYSLEAGLSRLQEQAAEENNEPKLEEYESLQKTIYDVHHASENGKEQKVADLLPGLLTGLEKIVKP